MTGPDHYTRAEQLLREVRDGHQEGTDVAAILSAAQVHAALALAAATALNDHGDEVSGGGMPLDDLNQWRETVGINLQRSTS